MRARAKIQLHAHAPTGYCDCDNLAAPSHPFVLANISSTISRMSVGVPHVRDWVFDLHATSKRNWRSLSSEGDQSLIAVCIHCPQSCTAMHGCSTWALSEDSLALASESDYTLIITLLDSLYCYYIRIDSLTCYFHFAGEPIGTILTRGKLIECCGRFRRTTL